MSRLLTIAAAQSGPVQPELSRSDVVERLLMQLREAHRCGCRLIVFTECALTPFFPHWWIEDERELEAYFETSMPNPCTQPLFDEARRLGIGFHLGFAELVEQDQRKRRFNSSVLVDERGQVVGRFRKVHLPGHADHRPQTPFQNLEKRYFEVGNLGFQTWNAFCGVVGMCMCNDRRWPETYRVLALKGAELILMGYNTPDEIPEHPELNPLTDFHHRLCLQSGAYQNGCWVVAAAKAGVEAGVSQIGLTSIVAPSGEIVAESQTRADELVIHTCDLDATRTYREFVFNFAQNRRVEFYGPITEQTDAVAPAADS